MSAVYKNVEPQDGSRGGTVFEGLSFWVAQKVPSRQWLLDMIKNNGGEVVKLEKQADMLIADYKDKQAPPGSYSFQFLTDATKSGVRPDKEEYLITRASTATKSTATKGTRTPFTAADDEELAHFMSLETQKTKGNEAFMRLEEQNGRHTYQSWRDRWLKKLSGLPQEHLNRLAQRHKPTPVAAKDVEIEEPSASHARTPPRPTTASPKNKPTAPRADQPTIRSPTAMRLPYTTDDDNILLKAINEALLDGTSTDSAWFRAFAEVYPHHSATSWYDHWRQVLRPKMAREGSPKTGESARDSSASDPKTSPARREQGDKSPPAGAHGRRPRESDIDNLAATVHETAASLQANSAEPTDPDRVAFFESLRQFLRSKGALNNRVDLEPTIAERVVDLYEVFELVQNLEVNVENADWKEMATALGFDVVKIPGAPAKVKKYWEVYLKDYFENLPLESDESQASSPGQIAPVEDREDNEQEGHHDEEGTLPNIDAPLGHEAGVTDAVQGKKRAGERESNESPHGSQGRVHKKSRRSRDDEIPSTPECRLRMTRGAPVPKGPAFHEGVQASHIALQQIATEVQDGADESVDVDDITPSQQLQAEEAATSPVPLRWPKKKVRRTREPPVSEGNPRESFAAGSRLPDAKGIGRWSQQVALEAASERSEGFAELTANVEHWKSLGYSADDARTALKATTLDTVLADLVLTRLKQGKGMPTNFEGVWTERDDEGLRFVNGQHSSLAASLQEADEVTRRQHRESEWARLVNKHTQDRVDSRRRFLLITGELAS